MDNKIMKRLKKQAENESLFDFYDKKYIAQVIKGVIEGSLTYGEIIEYCESHNVNPKKIKNNPMKFYDIINIFMDDDYLIEQVFDELKSDNLNMNLQYDDSIKQIIKSVAKNIDDYVNTEFDSHIDSEIDMAIEFME